MTAAETLDMDSSALSDTEKLCGLLLQLAGRSTGRMQSAKRHAEILEAAFPLMTEPQKGTARKRLAAIQTKWGPMLWPDADVAAISEISPVQRVGRWLSTRRTPVRYLTVLRQAAMKIWSGETRMSVVMNHAFAGETDYVLVPVGLTSFTEWMIELRIAQRIAKGIYAPGDLCGWWVHDMKRDSSAYRASLEAAAMARFKKVRSGR